MLQCLSFSGFSSALGKFLSLLYQIVTKMLVRCFIELATVPLYITELVPPKDRGILSDATAIFVNIGYVSASYVGVGFF